MNLLMNYLLKILTKIGTYFAYTSSNLIRKLGDLHDEGLEEGSNHR
jgi:hypothetical protein